MKEAPKLEGRFFFFPFSHQIKPSPQISFTKRVHKDNGAIETRCTQQREEGSSFGRRVSPPALLPCPCCWGIQGGLGAAPGGMEGELTPARADFHRAGLGRHRATAPFPISRRGSGEPCPAANYLGKRRRE